MSGVFRIDPAAILPPDPEHPGEYYLNSFVGHDPGLFAGVWSADAQETPIGSYPVDEICLVLSGTITVTDANGDVGEYAPGDAFAIRKGTALTWANTQGTRKIYVILDRAGLASLRKFELVVGPSGFVTWQHPQRVRGQVDLHRGALRQVQMTAVAEYQRLNLGSGR